MYIFGIIAIYVSNYIPAYAWHAVNHVIWKSLQIYTHVYIALYDEQRETNVKSLEYEDGRRNQLLLLLFFFLSNFIRRLDVELICVCIVCTVYGMVHSDTMYITLWCCEYTIRAHFMIVSVTKTIGSRSLVHVVIMTLLKTSNRIRDVARFIFRFFMIFFFFRHFQCICKVSNAVSRRYLFW